MSDELERLVNELGRLQAEYEEAEKAYQRVVHYGESPRQVLYRRLHDQGVLCPICQRVFIREHGNQRYCSRSCRQKAYYLRHGKQAEKYWKRCVMCQAGFAASRPSRLTCSERCQLDRRNFLARAQRKPKRRVYQVECRVCGSGFVSSVPFGKYCSEDCRRIGSNAGHRQLYTEKQVQQAVSKVVERVCVMCGSTFHGKRKTAMYCSLRCRRDASNIQRCEKRKAKTSKDR